jgi:hypothetical protein
MVPRGGSAESAKIKDLSDELSREGPIEAISGISADVPPSGKRKSTLQISPIEKQSISEQTNVCTAAPARMEPASTSEFEPHEHSAYIGRLYLGRYVRVAENQYAVYDARNRLLGRFRKRTDALAVFDR